MAAFHKFYLVFLNALPYVALVFEQERNYEIFHIAYYSANIYLFKFSNRNTRKRCEICSKLIIKTPDDCIEVGLVSLLTLRLLTNIFQNFF